MCRLARIVSVRSAPFIVDLKGFRSGGFGVRHSTEQTPQHPIQRRHPVSQPNRHVFVQRISKNEPKAGRAVPIAMPFLQIMDG